MSTRSRLALFRAVTRDPWDGALALVVLAAKVGLPVLLAAIVWRAWVVLPLRALLWPGLGGALIVACVAIARYQRRQLSWLDRIDELRRDGTL